MTTRTLTIKLDSTQAERSATRYEKRLKGVRRSGEQVDKSSAKLEKTLGRVKAAFVGVVSVAFLNQIKNVGVEFQALDNTLQTVFGSSEAAAREFEFIQGTAERLGLELQSTAGSYTKLAAAAQGTALEGENTREIFTSVAEASAVLGLSTDQAGGALTAIQQIMSKGTVQAEELRGQLGERLPGAFQIAARAVGVTTSELGKMLEQGQVISDEFLPLFAAELNRTFGDGVERATRRAGASFTRLKNELTLLQRDIAESGFLDALAAGADLLRDALASIDVQAVIKHFSDLFDVWERLFNLVGGGSEVFRVFANEVGVQLRRVGDLIGDIPSIFNGVVDEIEIFLSGASVTWIAAFRSFVDAVTPMARDIQSFFNEILEYGDAFVGRFESDIAKPLLKLVRGDDFNPAESKFAQFGDFLIDALVDLPANLSGIFTIMIGLTDQFVESAKAIFKILRADLDQIFLNIAENYAAAFDTVREFFGVFDREAQNASNERKIQYSQEFIALEKLKKGYADQVKGYKEFSDAAIEAGLASVKASKEAAAAAREQAADQIELSNETERLQAAFDEVVDPINRVDDVLQKLGDTSGGTKGSLAELSEEAKAIAKALESFSDSLLTTEAKADIVEGKLEILGQRWREGTIDIISYREEMAKLSTDTEAVGDSLADTDSTIRESGEAYSNWKTAVEGASEAFTEYKRNLGRATRDLREEFEQELLLIEARISGGQRAVDIENRINDAKSRGVELSREEAAAQVDAINSAQARLEVVEAWRSAYEGAIESVSDGLAQLAVDFITGNDEQIDALTKRYDEERNQILENAKLGETTHKETQEELRKLDEQYYKEREELEVGFWEAVSDIAVDAVNQMLQEILSAIIKSGIKEAFEGLFNVGDGSFDLGNIFGGNNGGFNWGDIFGTDGDIFGNGGNGNPGGIDWTKWGATIAKYWENVKDGAVKAGQSIKDAYDAWQAGQTAVTTGTAAVAGQTLSQSGTGGSVFLGEGNAVAAQSGPSAGSSAGSQASGAAAFAAFTAVQLYNIKRAGDLRELLRKQYSKDISAGIRNGAIDASENITGDIAIVGEVLDRGYGEIVVNVGKGGDVVTQAFRNLGVGGLSAFENEFGDTLAVVQGSVETATSIINGLNTEGGRAIGQFGSHLREVTDGVKGDSEAFQAGIDDMRNSVIEFGEGGNLSVATQELSEHALAMQAVFSTVPDVFAEVGNSGVSAFNLVREHGQIAATAIEEHWDGTQAGVEDTMNAIEAAGKGSMESIEASGQSAANSLTGDFAEASNQVATSLTNASNIGQAANDEFANSATLTSSIYEESMTTAASNASGAMEEFGAAGSSSISEIGAAAEEAQGIIDSMRGTDITSTHRVVTINESVSVGGNPGGGFSGSGQGGGNQRQSVQPIVQGLSRLEQKLDETAVFNAQSRREEATQMQIELERQRVLNEEAFEEQKLATRRKAA